MYKITSAQLSEWINYYKGVDPKHIFTDLNNRLIHLLNTLTATFLLPSILCYPSALKPYMIAAYLSVGGKRFGFGKSSLKSSTSFRVISSNQKLARTFTSTPKELARKKIRPPGRTLWLSKFWRWGWYMSSPLTVFS